MSILADTNILLRLAQPDHEQYATALAAMTNLRKRGDSIVLVPQNLYEFWVVGTRPRGENGLGWSVEKVEAEVAELKRLFPLHQDTEDIFPAWESLVVKYQVLGKTAHDARLNHRDFQRLKEITAFAPDDALAERLP